jgi:hypothetical protein
MENVQEMNTYFDRIPSPLPLRNKLKALWSGTRNLGLESKSWHYTDDLEPEWFT